MRDCFIRRELRKYPAAKPERNAGAHFPRLLLYRIMHLLCRVSTEGRGHYELVISPASQERHEERTFAFGASSNVAARRENRSHGERVRVRARVRAE